MSDAVHEPEEALAEEAPGFALAEPLRAAADDELRLYRRHHLDSKNWWIHAIAVPIEWSTWLVALRVLSASSGPLWICQSMLALLVWVATRSVLLGASQLSLAYGADRAVAVCGRHAMTIAAITWACSWVVQVGIGHWMIERNQPGMTHKLSFLSVLLSVSLAWDLRSEPPMPTLEEAECPACDVKHGAQTCDTPPGRRATSPAPVMARPPPQVKREHPKTSMRSTRSSARTVSPTPPATTPPASVSVRGELPSSRTRTALGETVKKRDLQSESAQYLPRQRCHLSLPPGKVACHLHEALRLSDAFIEIDSGPAPSD